MYLRLAKRTDSITIYNIYKSVINSQDCPWNELYPCEDDIETDLINNSLYVAVKDNLIIGAVSIIYLDDKVELERIVIDKSFQGNGYAYEMMNLVLSLIKNVSIIQLYVSINNLKAINLYNKIGFKIINHTQMYGQEYYLCEKKI
ncbi:MAG: GNAT family N-acetyltransferase [Anaeroplasma sp.]